MANNKTGLWKLGLSVIVIVVAVAAAFVWAQADIRAVDVKADGIEIDLTTLKKEGCKPSGINALNSALMQKDVATTQKDVAALQESVEEMKTTQAVILTTQTVIQTTQTAIQADTGEILRRLPK